MIAARIALMGDLMLGRDVANVLREQGAAAVWGDAARAMRRADLRAANLECVISDLGAPADKAHTRRAGAEAIDALLHARIDIVSLANNHALDFGDDALGDMIARLDAAGIAHVGAGRDPWQPRVLRIHSKRVGFLAFTDAEPAWSSRIAHSVDAPVERVRRAKRACDILIVSVHSALNYRAAPTPFQRRRSRDLVDAGANIVWCHGAKMLQPWERIGDSVILHDTGDITSDVAPDAQLRNELGAIFLVKNTRVDLAPIRIDGCLTRLAKGRDARLARQMARRRLR